MQIKTRTGARCALIAALLCLTAPALAEEPIDLDAMDQGGSANAASGVMVRPFSGPRSQTIHSRVLKALKKGGLTIVPVGFEAGVELADAPGPYIQVAKESGIRAYVHGKVKMTKRSWTLHLQVRDGATGDFIGEEQLTSGWLPGLLKTIDKKALSTLQPTLERASAPTTTSGASASASGGVGAADVELIPPGEEGSDVSLAGSEDGDDVDDDGASEDGGDARGRLHAPLEVTASGGGIIRMLSYTDAFLDTKRQELFPHGSPSLGIRVGASWYPAAHGGGTGVLSNIGLNAHFVRSIGGVTSASPEKLPAVAPQTEYETVFQEIDLGVRARVPMGDWELGFNLGWGTQQMGLLGDNGMVRMPYSDGTSEPYPGLIPDIDSTYYRFGADVGFRWLSLDWLLGVGMRTPDFSDEPGQIAHERWFPDVHATTATVNLGVGIPLSDTFSLALLADLRQTGMDMNSSTSSIIRDGYNGEAQLQNSIAGGAIDRYTLLMAGLTWRYGAGGESSSSDAEDEVYEDDDEAYEDDSESGAGDTSNPDFFSGDGSGAPATGGQDTSNPDFFE